MTYYFLRDNALTKQMEEAKPFISSISNLNVEHTPIRDKYSGQPDNPAQQITLLNEKVIALESRLRYMEAIVSEQAKSKTDSRPDKPGKNNSIDKAKTKEFSDADFGRWINESLNTGHVDPDRTQVITRTRRKKT
jgi:hypothetical protein